MFPFPSRCSSAHPGIHEELLTFCYYDPHAHHFFTTPNTVLFVYYYLLLCIYFCKHQVLKTYTEEVPSDSPPAWPQGPMKGLSVSVSLFFSLSLSLCFTLSSFIFVYTNWVEHLDLKILFRDIISEPVPPPIPLERRWVCILPNGQPQKIYINVKSRRFPGLLSSLSLSLWVHTQMKWGRGDWLGGYNS